MKNIKISQQEFQQMNQLYKDFYEIYGNKDAVWDVDDLEEM